MSSPRKYNRAYVPLVVSIAVVVGFLLGINIQAPTDGDSPLRLPAVRNNFNLLNAMVEYVDEEYVDPVEKQALIGKTAQFLLQELDPHSYYISAEELQAMNEPLEGNFEGIGIQFNIQKDTVVVVTPLSGGPSEKVGIKAGDRILRVNDELIAGVSIQNQDVIKKLKGAKGTKVKVEVQRALEDERLDFTIVRDEIPIYSVDVAYMLDEETGYIKISRFARTTYKEFMEAGTRLLDEGMEKLVLDLRGNGGGFLDAAVDIADEFLENNELIVYTEGRARPRSEYRSTSKHTFAAIEVAILIDESSASASEILAGAVQDNDRGTILGRRSFGKGLVQEQTAWPDGSATRLTIARYYTPTGRSIQRPYDEGTDSYHESFYDRYHNGEMLTADSIEVADSLRFVTPGGKVVYGGGGIMPDIFIPVDTNGASPYLNALFYTGTIYDYAFDYADIHREEINTYADWSAYREQFDVTETMLNELAERAEKNGVSQDPDQLMRSRTVIQRRLKAYIARNIWNNEGFYPLWNADDRAVKQAVEVLN